MARRKFKNGMVVWAKVPDRIGIVKASARPLLITSVHPTRKDAPFVAHCISTRQSDDPHDPVIEMPWDQNTGKTTGLFSKCAVVLRWAVVLDPKDVEEVGGYVEQEFLDRVLQEIALLRGLSR